MLNSVSLKIKLALITAVSLWASAYVGIRAGLQGYSPGGLALLRFLIASLCIAIAFSFSKNVNKNPIRGKNLFFILLTGIIGVGFYNIALNRGEVLVPSGMASFIVSQSPIMSTLLAVIFLNERMSFIGIIGMVVSVIGVFIITLSGGTELKFYISILYVIAAMIIGSFYSIMQKHFLKQYNAIDLTAYAIWGATLGLLFFLPDLYHDVTHAPLKATLAAVYLGIFPAAVAYLAWNYVLAVMPASQAVSFLYLSPIIATALGWFWLKEVPAVFSIVGGLVALLGVWIVNQSYQWRSAVVRDNFANE